MFETGNYRRRRRMKRYRTATPYAKPLFRDASGFRTPAHHHHHQLPLGTRNLFGTPSAYPPPYTRYDPRWVHWNTVTCWGFGSGVWGSVTRRYSFYYTLIFCEWQAIKNKTKCINLLSQFFLNQYVRLSDPSGRSLAGIAGSNPVGGIDACQLWVLCVVGWRSLRWPDHSFRGVIPTVVRVSLSVIRRCNNPLHLYWVGRNRSDWIIIIIIIIMYRLWNLIPFPTYLVFTRHTHYIQAVLKYRIRKILQRNPPMMGLEPWRGG